MGKRKRPRVADTIFDKIDQVSGLKLPNFNTYYNSTVFNTV